MTHVERCLLICIAVAAMLAAGLQLGRASADVPGPLFPVPGGVATSQRVVALTFDDGPSPYTPRILSVLHAFGVPGTFFLIGEQVERFPALVRAEVAAGNEVGNHTFHHYDLRFLSSTAIALELRQTQDAIRSAAGVTPRWFRPPEGAVDSRVADVAASLGLHTVLWDVDPLDWARPGTGSIVSTVLAETHPGSIVIMHDGGGDRSETVAALPTVIRDLRARGYSFATVSALFGEAAGRPCNTKLAVRWFGDAGQRAGPAHAIFRAWLDRYCRGDNLGPATSPEYVLAPYVVAQNFARTAHRIEWRAASSSTHVTIMWDWAAGAFAALGIAPQWGTPITRSWFAQYLGGRDWGAARTRARVQQGHAVQCFRYGCARASRGAVTWSR